MLRAFTNSANLNERKGSEEFLIFTPDVTVTALLLSVPVHEFSGARRRGAALYLRSAE